MFTKPGSLHVLVSLMQMVVLNTLRNDSRPFHEDCVSFPNGLQNTIVLMSAWNLPVSIGFLFLTSLKRLVMSCLLIPSIQSHKKAIKPTARMLNGKR